LDREKLRGAIYSKFKSASACASVMGWHKQKLSKVINGQYVPNVDEIKEIAKVCQMSNAEFDVVFLPFRSQNL